MFLAGKNRTVLSGGKLGFHSPYILKDEEERYYQNFKAKKGWRDEFDYVVYIYERGYEDAILDIDYMKSRGVSLKFTLKALKVPANKIWHSTVNELLVNGVIDAMQ